MNKRSQKLAKLVKVDRAVAAIPGLRKKPYVPPVDPFPVAQDKFPPRKPISSVGFRYSVRFILYGKVVRVIANKTIRTAGLNKAKILTDFLKTAAITDFKVTGGRATAFAENPDGNWITVEADLAGVVMEGVNEQLVPLDGV